MATKRIIWTNQIDSSKEGIQRYRQEACEDDNTCSDDQIIERMYEENAIWLDDEKLNLDLATTNPILAIADLGLWNGRRTGYRVLGRDVRDIFQSTCGDFITFYADAYNIHCEDIHHDGTNRYLFRELIGDEDECQPLLDAIYSNAGKEKIQSLIRRYTRSLLPYAAKVYGWPVAGRPRKEAA